MLERLDSAISSLQEEEKTLLGRKSELDQQASELDAALKRVRGALSALGAATSGKPGGKRGPAKPSPDKNVVRDAVTQSLRTQSLRENDLRAEVERRVASSGYSRMGLSLRLKEVLGEDQFTRSPQDDQLVMLRDSSAAEATPVLQEHAAESNS